VRGKYLGLVHIWLNTIDEWMKTWRIGELENTKLRVKVGEHGRIRGFVNFNRSLVESCIGAKGGRPSLSLTPDPSFLFEITLRAFKESLRVRYLKLEMIRFEGLRLLLHWFQAIVNNIADFLLAGCKLATIRCIPAIIFKRTSTFPASEQQVPFLLFRHPSTSSDG